MLKKLGILVTVAASSLVLSAPVSADSTDNMINDFQTWGNITAVGSLGVVNPKLEKWRYWLEGQGRFGNDSSQFSQSLIRPGVGYQVHRTTSVWLGYAWAPTAQPFTKAPFDEQRIWQQVLWQDRFSFGTVASRSRVEQRFDPWQSGDVAYRYRHLVRVLMPLPQAPAWGLVLANEVFVHLNSVNWGPSPSPTTGFDQNRAFAGVAYTFNKNARTEIGYMNQIINLMHNPINRMDHNLSVNLFLNF